MINKMLHHRGLCTVSVDYVVFMLVEAGTEVVSGLSNIFHATDGARKKVNDVLCILLVLLNRKHLIGCVVLNPFQL